MGTFLLAIILTSRLDASVWYVDASQTSSCEAQDGTTWSTSFKYLQDAIENENLQPGDTIRVSQGVYHSDDTCAAPNSDDQTASFVLKFGVIVEGGYKGRLDLANANVRDLTAYESILSGDLTDNDNPALGLDQTNRLTNSYIVVSGGTSADPIDQTSKVDGFTIRDGHGPGGSDVGAGLFIPETDPASNPTIANCLFTRNYAGNSGGAVYQSSAQGVTGATMSFDHCRFIDNEAVGAGGAIMGELDTRLHCEGCTFTNNRVTEGDGGGAYFGHQTDAIFTECAFDSNSHLADFSGAGGGAIRVVKAKDLEIRSSSFTSNFSATCGGVFGVGAKGPPRRARAVPASSARGRPGRWRN